VLETAVNLLVYF